MKLNFAEIELLDLDGKIVPNPEIHKSIARAVYHFSKNLDLVDIARQINRGDEVELRDSEVAEIRRIVQSPEVKFLAFAKKAINDFLAEKERKWKEQQKSQSLDGDKDS